MLDISKAVKMAMLQKDIKPQELAVKLGVSKQQVSNMFSRNSWKEDKLKEVMELIGYDVEWKETIEIKLIDKENGKIIDVD